MKTRYIIAIAAAALMLVGCQKNDFDTVFAGSDGIVKFEPSVSDGGADANTKGELYNETGDPESLGKYVDEFMVAAWNIPSPDDPAQIIPDNTAKAFTGGYVSDNQQYQKVKKRTGAGSKEYWMTVQPYTPEGGAATIADDEYIWKSGEVKTFYAYANLPESGATVTNTASGQTLQYTVPAIASAQTDILLGFYNGTGGGTGTASIKFQHPLTAVKFKQGEMTGVTGIKSITLSGLAKSGTVTMDKDGVIGNWTVTDNDYTATATLSDGENLLKVDAESKLIGKDSKGNYNGAFLLIPQTLSDHNITVTAVFSTASGEITVCADITADTWLAGNTNTYTMKYDPTASTKLTVEVTEWDSQPVVKLPMGEGNDLLSGKFSINSYEYAQFSRGNLQASIDASGSPIVWKFAENQYDVVGKSSANLTIGIAAGEIDLFGWSGSTGTAYGISTSTSNTDYSGDFVDWGTAMDEAGWLTLSKAEWDYLLNARITTCTISGKASSRYVKCTITGVAQGIMLFPDDFIWPTEFVTAPTDSQINAAGNSFVYTCTPADFKILENSGAVFLPLGGYRKANSFNSGSEGYYWTSTPSGTSAYSFNLKSNAAATGTRDKYYGQSVRLVQKSTLPDIEPAFVDFGLPSGTLWANVNVGAKGVVRERSYGLYYSWGNTTGYRYNGTNWVTDADGTVLSGGFTSANYKTTVGYTINNSTVLWDVNVNDAARAYYGGDYRMPTKAEIVELVKNTYWKYDSDDMGYYVFIPLSDSDKGGRGTSSSYSKSDAKMFIPCAGNGAASLQNTANGYYPSSDYSSSTQSFGLYFTSTSYSYDSYKYSRELGLPVRAVKPGHDVVKIGNVYWATENIGAETPQDYGWFFSWGNTTGYVRVDGWSATDNDNWKEALSGTPLEGGFSQATYNKTSGSNLSDNIPVSSEYDAGRAIWGKPWRMPTHDEVSAMIAATYWKWDATDKGYYIYTPKTASDAGKINNGSGTYNKTDALMFIPASGASGEMLSTPGAYGYFWQSTFIDESNAYIFGFAENNYFPDTPWLRHTAFPIRPVHD